MSDYYYQDGNDQAVGPLSREDVLEMMKSGTLTEDTLMRTETSKWRAAKTYPELTRRIAPPQYSVPVAARTHESAKAPPSFAALAVLALLIWPIGVIGGIAYLGEAKTKSYGAKLIALGLFSALVSILVWQWMASR